MTDRLRVAFPALPLAEGIDSSQITDLGNITLRGDVRSYAWDGGGDLSGGADPDATAGFLLDSSAGAAQFQNLIAEGGLFSGDLEVGSDPYVHVKTDTVTILDGSLTSGLNIDAYVQIGGTWASAAIDADAYLAADLDGDVTGDPALLVVGPGDDDTAGGQFNAAFAAFSYDNTLGRTFLALAAEEVQVSGVGSGAGVNLVAASGAAVTIDSAEPVTVDVGSPVASEVVRFTDGQIQTADGSASSPINAFSSDPDTGSYKIGANVFGVAAGGSEALRVGSSYVQLQSVRLEDLTGASGDGLVLRTLNNPNSGDPIFQVRSSGASIRLSVDHDGWVTPDGASGSAGWDHGNPERFGWRGQDEYIDRAASNIRVVVDGDIVAQFNSDGLLVRGSGGVADAGDPRIEHQKYTFQSDTDTYFSRPAANTWRAVAGGTVVMEHTPSRTRFPGVATTTDSGLAAWRNDGFPGDELLALTSSMRVKDDIRDLDYAELAELFLATRLASWRSTLPRDDHRRRYTGWIAEEVQAQLPRYAAKPDADGYVSGIGDMEVPMAAAIHYLHDRVARLEQQLADQKG